MGRLVVRRLLVCGQGQAVKAKEKRRRAKIEMWMEHVTVRIQEKRQGRAVTAVYGVKRIVPHEGYYMVTLANGRRIKVMPDDTDIPQPPPPPANPGW